MCFCIISYPEALQKVIRLALADRTGAGGPKENLASSASRQVAASLARFSPLNCGGSHSTWAELESGQPSSFPFPSADFVIISSMLNSDPAGFLSRCPQSRPCLSLSILSISRSEPMGANHHDTG
jgi:hypothetical protein